MIHTVEFVNPIISERLVPPLDELQSSLVAGLSLDPCSFTADLSADDVLVLRSLALAWLPGLRVLPATPASLAFRTRMPAILEAFADPTNRALAPAWFELLDVASEAADLADPEPVSDHPGMLLRSACWVLFDLVAGRGSNDPFVATSFKNASVRELCFTARLSAAVSTSALHPLAVFLAKKHPDTADLDWLRTAHTSAVRLLAAS